MRTIPFNFAAQVAAGTAVATLIAATARRFGALTGSGMVAAIVVGASAAAAGWGWAAMVILFFVSSASLSRLGLAAKHARSGGRLAKPGARDATQVFANGGVFAVASGAFAVAPNAAFAVAAMGALAAATSDTWATEVGMLASAPPRSITSGNPVRVGTSGGVTIAGLIAGGVGAVAIAVGGHWMNVTPGVIVPVVVGGAFGMLADSLLGATLQAERHCERCNELTERVVHGCGALTRRTRGLRWLDNDGVNAAATMTGAVVAVGVHFARTGA